MTHRRSQSANPESGFILLAVLFMVALVLIALAVAAPRIAASIQRDREDELMHRGLEYRHAIKLYYKKFGRYPASIDQLENTNNIRFLRKRYVDPMTGKDDWKIIQFGQAHVKPMGFFGQPIANSGTAGSSILGGAGQAGALGGLPGASGLPGSSGAFGTSGALGGLSGASGLPGSSGAFGTSGALQSTSGSLSSSTGSDSSSSTSSGSSSPSGAAPTGSTSSFGGINSSTGGPGAGQTFGGGAMVGVASKSTKASIKEYKQQKHYNEWEFVYDPIEDMQSTTGILGGGTQNLNGTSTPNSPFSSGPTNNGTGTNTPTSPGTGTSTSPTTPPQ